MPLKRSRKGKQANKFSTRTVTSSSATPSDTAAPDDNAAAAAAPLASEMHKQQPFSDLILTSEKRRGVYECDYCRSDISQLPRVRCAVCPDFDLCLDCFVTSDHAAMADRLKAVTAATAATSHHLDSHGYHVCYSTRYPLFPASRQVTATVSRSASVVADDDEKKRNGENDGDDSTNKLLEKEAAATAAETPVQTPEQESSSQQTEVTRMESTLSSIDKDTTAETAIGSIASVTSDDNVFVVQTEDPKNVWTVEEDLRLLEGIRMHGLANWVEIAEVVGGQGSTGKTPKRCMERYFDDFLGRYGHILPAYTLVAVDDESPQDDNDGNDNGSNNKDDSTHTPKADEAAAEETPARASKRRAVLMRSPHSTGAATLGCRKKFKVVPTESTADFDTIAWPTYMPNIPGVKIGQEVGRDQSYKAEQAFVRAIASLDSKEKVEQVRKEWAETRLNKPGGPTVLPMRPDDVVTMPGAELAGFMPRRGDFDVEWENDAEQAVADIEFLPGESEQDKQLKLQVLAIYNSRLDEREKRKQFILSRKLYDYRKRQADDQLLPRDERDLVQRMRLFERFHTPQEHDQFIADILKAKRLRKEIAKLQLYRRIGIRTLAEAEQYELDKARHNFHKSAHLQKEAASKTAAGSSSDVTKKCDDNSSAYLWKQYKTTDRKVRKSINRGKPGDPKDAPAEENPESETNLDNSETELPSGAPAADDPNAMDVDQPDSLAITEEVVKEKDGKDKAQVVESHEDILAQQPGYSLLSEREVALCRKAKLLPAQYLELKRVLIHESLTAGLLDKDSSRRILVKIDVDRRGDVIDFMVRAGWVSTTVGEAARCFT